MGRMDKQQLKSALNFNEMGKNAQRVTQSINDQIKARKDLDKEEERITKARAKREIEAYIEDLRRTKDANAARIKEQKASDAEAARLIDRHLREQQRIRDRADREERTSRERADRDRARSASRAAREAILEAERFQKLMSKYRPGFGGSNKGEFGDRARKDLNLFSQGLSNLTQKFHDNNRGSNTFYVRILGLRLPILALAAAFPPLIGALVQAAGLLVAVAEAAALAGAALGGALIAGIAQATPVIGLLVLAFKQLFNIVKLTSDQQKLAGRQAQEQADKSLALQRRIEQERQAHIALANAQKQVIDARRAALRNIEDLNNAEKEATRTSQQATLSLIGSQDALGRAVAGGGSALDIASAQAGVAGARGAVGAAALNQSRARADAAKARREGVAGNAQVISAQQQLIAQQHEMALSSAEFANQQQKTNLTLSDYQKKLAALDPAQRKLFDSIVALRKEWKNEWRGITDPIIDSFTKIVKSITNALKDSDIQKAFRGLSGATGGAVTDATSFMGTPEAKRLFLQVIHDAKENLPLISRILRDINAIFLRIAVAAGPFLHEILKGIRDFFNDVEVKTRDSGKLTQFFTVAFQAANAFWNVLTGILDIFIALGEGGAAKAGIDLVGQLGIYLHNIGTELRGNKEGTNAFFANLAITVGDLGTLLDHVIRALIEIANTGAFDVLVKVLDQEVLPILRDLLITAGKIIVVLGNFTLENPGLLRTTAVIAGIGFAALKVFGILNILIRGMAALRAAMVLNAAIAVATSSAEVIAAREAALAMEASWIAMLGPIAIVIAAIAAIGIAIYLLDKKFHFIQPTIAWLSKFVRNFGTAFIDAKNDIGGAVGSIVDKIVWLFGIIKDFLGLAIRLYLTPYKIAVRAILNVFKDIASFIGDTAFGDLLKGVWSAISPILDPVVNKIKDIYGWMLNIEKVSRRLLHLGQGNASDNLTRQLIEKARAGGASEQEIQQAIDAQQGPGTYNRIMGRSGTTPLPTGGQGPAKGTGGVTRVSNPRLIGQPHQGTHNLGNWQSDNAVDIALAPNTPIYATEDGVIGNRIGHTGGDDPRFAGMRLTLQGASNSYFYQHLEALSVAAGQKVKKGDLLGYAGALNHVHFAVQKGDPNKYVNAAPSTGARTTRTTPRSTGATPSTSMNTDPTRSAGAGSAVPDIIRAAQATGIDPAIFLATALTESGGRYGAVGDKGTSFGPFQHHKGGALGSHTAAWANSYEGILERAQQFKRLQISTGAGAAALQKPADRAGYASKVNANVARAQQLLAEVGLSGGATTTTSAARTKPAGPGARGGEAINPLIQDVMDAVPNFLKLTVQDVIDTAKKVFRDKSARGGNALVKVLNEFGGVFEQMAKRYSVLLSTQKHRLISRRYRVSGASGNTSVQDQGTDLGDAQQTLSDLGFDRDSLLAQTNDVNSSVKRVRGWLSQTKNKNRRQILQGTLNGLLDKQRELQSSLDQNVLDIVAAQDAVLNASINAITSYTNMVVGSNSVQIAIARLTGIGKGSIPQLITNQIYALMGEHGALEQALSQAHAQGNETLAMQIQTSINEIDQQINQLAQDRFDAVIALVEDPANRQLSGNDRLSRLNALGGRAFNSLQGQAGVLGNKSSILSQERAGLIALLPYIMNPAQAEQISDKIAELDTQLAENADAIRENSEQIKQARVDQITSRTGFRSGINSGIQGLIESLASGTGALDLPSKLRALDNQGGNLRQAGSDYRGQLLSQFGINLSSDPRQLISQINSTDFTALEFGMDDPTKSTFEELINRIIENATAIQDNTNELAAANSQTIQDWSSSLWSTFRDALFTGNGGILGSIPQAATGAHVMSAGLVKVHAGETIKPAGVSSYKSGGEGINIPIHIDNRGEGDVDPLALSKRLGFELSTRGR